jgi:hypothetical protein
VDEERRNIKGKEATKIRRRNRKKINVKKKRKNTKKRGIIR